MSEPTAAEAEQSAVTKVHRAELVKRILIVVTALMVALTLLLLVVLIGQIRATQQSGSPVLKAIQRQNDTITDCTQPTGACYEDGQDRTTAVLSSAQQIIVLAAACAVDVTPAQSVDARIADITACITKRLTAP